LPIYAAIKYVENKSMENVRNTMTARENQLHKKKEKKESEERHHNA
jgi:hypothetical protein